MLRPTLCLLFITYCYATTCYTGGTSTGVCDASNNQYCFQRTGLVVNPYSPGCCNISDPSWLGGCPPGLPAGPIVAYISIASEKKCFKANLGTNKLELATCNAADSLQQFQYNDDSHYQLVGTNLCVDRGTYTLGNQIVLATCSSTSTAQKWLWFDGYCSGGAGFTLGMEGAYPPCNAWGTAATVRANNQVVCLKPDLVNNKVVQGPCDACNVQAGCSPCGSQCETSHWWVNANAY